jgi:hypothetical protein
MAARKGPTPRKAAAGKPAPRKDFEVVPNAAGGFDGQCLRSFGCGDPGGSPFASTGWTTRQQAETRMAEHIAEHDDKCADDADARVLRRSRARTAARLIPGRRKGG